MYATPNRRLGFSSLPPNPAPFLTPRPEKRPFDLRWTDGGSASSRNDRDREVNIQVMLRCRPLTDEEQRLNVQKVVSCNEQKNEVTVLQSLVNRQLDKTFTFDKIFGSKVQQRSVYDHAIAPIVNDVLEGFNCTVFAYGQTGTGKTYTMEGGMKHKGGDLSSDAGVIPRAVRHIFDTLEAQKADYNMKVTFLELYNEEITDLLAPEDHTRFTEDRQRRPISLMEDGKGGAVIRGLEEVAVYSANEIYKLLEHGSARRRTADTLLNKQSSRSHSVFSITIHVKEVARGNEELIKCGRLHLVDLAGSENISRSGSREVRLLTLLNLLGTEGLNVDSSSNAMFPPKDAIHYSLNESMNGCHQLYTPVLKILETNRDSKLTRLLRESLGGKAKTCFIATVSPSIHCLDETLSTLDYAYRAKSIKNKPEANQKFSKSVLLKDLYLEMERMKQDVRAAREKNGVYIPHERFVQDEAEKKAMSEKIEHLKSDLERKIKQADRFQDLYHAEEEKNLDLESEIRECKANFESNKNAFLDLQEAYARTNMMLNEKEFIISKLLHSESAILEHAKQLRSSLENASEDMSMLLAKIERQSKIETENQGLILTFGSQLDQSLKSLHETVMGSVCQQHELLKSMEEHVNSFITTKCEANQKFSKSVLLKDLYLEMERMKQDVRAAREKNGVYIPHERFVQDEAEKKAMSEKIEHLKSDLERKIKQADRFQDLYHAEEEKNLDLESEIRECKANFESNKNAFLDLQEAYARTNMMLNEKEFIISKLLHSESAILEHAKQLRSSLENASEDMSMLLAKIERQSKIETENQGLILTFGSQLDQSLKSLHETVMGSVCQQHELLKSMEEHVNSFITTKCEATKCLELKIEKIKDTYTSGILCMKELATALQKKGFSDLEEMKLSISAQMMAVENFLVTAVSEAEQVLTDVQRSLAEQKMLLAFSAQQQEAGLQRSLVSTQAISKTTINFFNDLRSQATRLTTLLEENRLEKSHQLAAFGDAFKVNPRKQTKRDDLPRDMTN
ncbi:hypothetical protein COCNU_scaffold000429G000020 [Cocos nucifera]|nr:hypothetical protein [Cocos nucifera]